MARVVKDESRQKITGAECPRLEVCAQVTDTPRAVTAGWACRGRKQSAQRSEWGGNGGGSDCVRTL